MIWKALRTRSSKVRKPAQVEVKARRIDFAFDERTPRYWFDEDAFSTHFLNALSITFPEGEHMFMDAVRAVRDRVQDPQTRADINGFMGQEALHSRAHEAFNKYMEKFGYPMAELEQAVREDIAGHRPEHTDASLLALTCALEHVTAIMGNLLLTRPDLQEQLHESVRPLWLWHALEETEHKAVAFDVYQELYGSYRERVTWLLISTVGLLAGTFMFQHVLLQHDGLAGKPSVYVKGLWKMWGPRGLLLSLIPDWLQYFRPDFHPWQQDNSALIAKFRAQFEGEAAARLASYSAANANDSSEGSDGKRVSKKSAQARM